MSIFRPTLTWAQRHSTGILAALFLLTWWTLTLRHELPVLLGLTASLAVIWWILRHRRHLAVDAVLAAAATATPACAALAVIDHNPAALDSVAVLLGYTAVGAAPTVTAYCLDLAPRSRTRTALAATAMLLASGAIAAWATGPAAALLLPASTIGICGGVWRYHHRRPDIPGATDLGRGWIDLGQRRLPGGQHVHHLALGPGYGITACTIRSGKPSQALLLDAIRRAAAAADAIGLPASRMQPVLLTTAADAPTRHLVNTGDIAAAVTVAHPKHLPLIAADAPRRRGQTRGPLRRAAALPTDR